MLRESPPVPDALANFDHLPDSSHVRLPVVGALFGVSAATVWRMVRAGRLPKPRKLSERTTAWNVGELRAALHALETGATENPVKRKALLI